MHKMDSDLSQLDDKINQLQAALDDLRRARQVLIEARHQYSRQHMPLLSPIRCLPPEILAEIFLRSIPSDPYFSLTLCYLSFLRTLHDLRRTVMLPGSVSLERYCIIDTETVVFNQPPAARKDYGG